MIVITPSEADTAKNEGKHNINARERPESSLNIEVIM
jgi:hypothetical protein